MATHGRDRFSLVLRRGVADEVIRRAGCPVVTVRAPVPPPATESPVAVSYPW
jgi:nucleotide-binding universal stress UspA family protein